MADANEVSFPEEWKTPPLRLAEQDSEPRVTAIHLAEQAEIERLSEKANAIPGKNAWAQ